MNNAKKYKIRIGIAVTLLLSVASFTFLNTKEINQNDNLMEVLNGLGHSFRQNKATRRICIQGHQ